MLDVDGKVIQIGDIVKIEGLPIKSDNAFYVVFQDGTSAFYNDKTNLTLYKAGKYKGGYAISSSKYNLRSYPLSNFSSRYKYSRAEMDAAEIEIIQKAKPERFELVRVSQHEPESDERDYYNALVTGGTKGIADFSYLVSQADKLTALFSNLILKETQKLEIKKQNPDYGSPYRNGVIYELRESGINAANAEDISGPDEDA